MKKLIFLACMIVTSSLSAQMSWKADPPHSNVNFAISHLMISEVTGNFGEFEIEATADESFSNPDFTVSISTNSIDTGNTRRDDHLRSEDFFEVAAYPNMTFKSTAYEKTGDKTFNLKGDLSIHGVTKPVDLEGKLNGIITDERSQKLKAGLKLTGTINRKDFGVGTKEFPIGDEVELRINLEMAQQ
jgi:polyisoprenoid-binding protein YceI